MEKEIIDNHARYLERIKLFKSFGYDADGERNFIIENVGPVSGEILEAGTGKGHFTIALARKGFSFVSVDVSCDEQNFARMNIKYLGLEKQVDFQISDAENLHFEDNSFDNIFAVNLVHHLENPFKVVDEMARILNPGGKMVLSDFNKKGFEIIKKIHESEGGTHDEGKAGLKNVDEYLLLKGFTSKEYNTDLQQMFVFYKQ
ncbi:MAG: class I SAM-dependent methyltransferase [Candidatus Omnitrophica bacterium]|nr:class I SAM-dependent methyltransferase [Candidatus Omnitrophota bacterium]